MSVSEIGCPVSQESCMIEVMAKVRLVLQVEEETRAALRIESATQDRDMSVIVEELIRAGISETLKELIARRKNEEKRSK